MKSKQLSDDTYVLVFDKGDEAMSELQRFVEAHELGAARFTGIGGFRAVTLGYFEHERMTPCCPATCGSAAILRRGWC